MEIERKFLVKQIPEGCTSFPCRQIEQAYLNTDPVVRVRRDNDDYYLTYKGKGLLSREEYNLPLNKEAYEHLLSKADGIILTKKRYMIPVPGSDHLTIELDIFEGHYDGLILAEVEFSTEEEAKAFIPPVWFGEDVTFSGEYHNSRLSQG
ncbi:MAG: CYTH domain-containing protein [Enterocloster sp.]